MLTNLDWISEGAKFPPEEELGRLKSYKNNDDMFKGDFVKTYGSYFASLAQQLRMKSVNIETALNYPQLLTKKTADFVCSESPDINIGDEQTDNLNSALAKINFYRILYEAIMDVSRFGNAVVKIMQDKVSIIPPEYWYPVVNIYDAKQIDYQVIAFAVGNVIRVEIHSVGAYEVRTYQLEKDSNNDTQFKFGKLIKEDSYTEQTGFDDFAVQILTNITESKQLYGISDYNCINDIYKQLLWRIYTVERILDKHAAPSIVGPSSMLSKDPVTGIYMFNSGNFFKRDSEEDAMPKYLTWDGNLDSVQWEIEYLTNQMYALSEMGAAFLEGAGKGEANSGRALRLRMTSPLIKAQRLIGINEQAVKRIIRGIAIANGIMIDTSDIAITWNDGLPNDIVEEADLYVKATGGKPFMSQAQAIKMFNDLNDEDTESTLEIIEAEHTDIFVGGSDVE